MEDLKAGIRALKENDRMCDYPCEDKCEETVQSGMTLEEFDPIVGALVHYANREGYLRSETYHWKEKGRLANSLRGELDMLQSEHDKLKVNRDLWYDAVIKYQNKENSKKEKARKAKKTAKKVK